MLTTLFFWNEASPDAVSWLSYLTVYLLSTFHFFSGLTVGIASGMALWEIMLCGLLGIMTTLSVFLFGGKRLAAWVVQRLPKRWKPSDDNPRWQRYRTWGSWGVTCSIHILINPILGGLLHLSLKSPTRRTWLFSWLCCGFWVAIISLVIYYSVDLALG